MISIVKLENTGIISSEDQATAFQNAINLAIGAAPICTSSGEDMVITGIDFSNEFTLGIPGTYFLNMVVSYGCCSPPTDCDASFDIFQSSKDCRVYLTNSSTPSSINDCGDCENPSGITSVHWSIDEYHEGDPFSYISPFTGSNDFHFDFNPADAQGPNDGFQICLTIEDCLGCRSTECVILNQFVLCREVKSNEVTAKGKLMKKIIPAKRPVIVYPNPTSDIINIQWGEEFKAEKFFSIDILDLSGKKIKSLQLEYEDLTSIDVSGLEAGMYFLSVTIEGRILHTQKIFIQ